MAKGAVLVVRPEYATALSETSLWDSSPDRGVGGRGIVRHAVIRGNGPGGARAIPVLLRPYRHGGFLRVVTRDLFRTPTRGLREVELATVVRRLGIESAEVIGLRIRRGPLGLCRMDLATRELSGGTDLATYARTGHVDGEWVAPRAVAAATARILRKLHDERIHHRDLHLGNLLVTRDRIPRCLVIDLDKCLRVHRLSEGTRRAMLARLYRSLRKREVEYGVSLLSCTDCARFLRAYSGPRWRDDWRAVARRFLRTYPFHRLAWTMGGWLRGPTRPGVDAASEARRDDAGPEDPSWPGRPFRDSALAWPSSRSR